MDWLQFLAAIIGHLAWPIVFLIVIFSVRAHLGSLAERVLELSFGGATLKFDKFLSKGAELIEGAPKSDVSPADALQGLPALNRDGETGGVTREDLWVLIFHARHEVFGLVEQCAEELGVKTRDPRTILRMLYKRDLISPEIMDLHETLEQAQEAAFRISSLTRLEAAEFLRQNVYLKLVLHRALSELKVRKVKMKP